MPRRLFWLCNSSGALQLSLLVIGWLVCQVLKNLKFKQSTISPPPLLFKILYPPLNTNSLLPNSMLACADSRYIDFVGRGVATLILGWGVTAFFSKIVAHDYYLTSSHMYGFGKLQTKFTPAIIV